MEIKSKEEWIYVVYYAVHLNWHNIVSQLWANKINF